MVATSISYDAKPPQAASEQGRALDTEFWNVVRVMTNRERETRDELTHAGWEVYCPMETRWRKPRSHETQIRLSRLRDRRSAAVMGAQAITVADSRERALAKALRIPQVSSVGRLAEVEDTRALFPGYLFVKEAAGRSLGKILKTRHQPGVEGVAGLVQRADGTLSRIGTSVITKLMAAETLGAFSMSRKARRDVTAMFTKGQAVQVMGEYDGIVGEVVRCSPSGRMKIMLEKFGSVEVECSLVEAVS